MEFRTKVEPQRKTILLGHSDSILLMGSCFAGNFGNFLAENKFQCCSNPFGTLYNPLSIAEALQQLYGHKCYDVTDLFHDNGLWHSWMHHGSFSTTNADETLQLIRKRMDDADIKHRNAFVITFGTAWVYERNGKIVGNCHKMPEGQFTHRMLSVDEIVARWETLPFLHDNNSKVIFTVSPIRHQRDGFHANQLSKATLLLAIDKLVSHRTHCVYFPAYEILLDELRDYRFYAEDMLHPSSVTLQYILERFQETFFDAYTQQVLAQWHSLQKLLQHRPINPQAPSWQQFLSQTIQKLHQFQDENPFILVENEILQCQNQLNQSAKR